MTPHPASVPWGLAWNPLGLAPDGPDPSGSVSQGYKSLLHAARTWFREKASLLPPLPRRCALLDVAVVSPACQSPHRQARGTGRTQAEGQVPELRRCPCPGGSLRTGFQKPAVLPGVREDGITSPNHLLIQRTRYLLPPRAHLREHIYGTRSPSVLSSLKNWLGEKNGDIQTPQVPGVPPRTTSRGAGPRLETRGLDTEACPRPTGPRKVLRQAKG